MKTYSVILNTEINKILFDHLIRRDGQEDVCFATYLPSNGSRRNTGIIQSIILPEEGDRVVHGNVEFTSKYVARVIEIAIARKEGLVLLHSHPLAGWQNMSTDDVISENRIASNAYTISGLPLLGMTLGNDGSWSARFWLKDARKKRTFHRQWCESVRVIGYNLAITFNSELLKPNTDSERQLRTISAWGKKTQEDLSRLRIGIVGLGSVGSIVAEILARTGISNFTLIDFDSVELKNLDKLANVFKADIGKAKVNAIEKAILKSASSPKISITKCEFSICERHGYEEAINCDILFSCVDRPWARHILNYISYCHYIPVIDGGIIARTNSNNTKLMGAEWKVQTVGYKRPCLECLRQYDMGMVSLEKEGCLDDPQYIKQLGATEKKQVDAHENVYPFSSYTASMEVIQLLNLFVVPPYHSNIGQHMYHLMPGIMDINTEFDCREDCFFKSILGKGDSSGIEIYGKHKVAEAARHSRQIKAKRKKFLFFNY